MCPGGTSGWGAAKRRGGETSGIGAVGAEAGAKGRAGPALGRRADRRGTGSLAGTETGAKGRTGSGTTGENTYAPADKTDTGSNKQRIGGTVVVIQQLTLLLPPSPVPSCAEHLPRSLRIKPSVFRGGGSATPVWRRVTVNPGVGFGPPPTMPPPPGTSQVGG